MSTVFSLKDRKWKDFNIEDVCEIKSGRDIYERERIEGPTPYISATANNNGIGYYVDNKNETLEAGCLSINRNGSVGYCFYHPYKALFGNDTRKLIPHVKDKYALLFLSVVITKQKDKYGYGLKMGTGRLKRQKIMLPVDDNDNPDWKFMSDYMQEKERALLYKYSLVVKKRKREVGNIEKPFAWRTMKIEKDVFQISATRSSIDKVRLNGLSGIYPYVSRSAMNNGIERFVAKQSGYDMDEKNVITVGLDTQTVFFQPMEFYTGQNNQVFRNSKMQKYEALMLCVLLQKQMRNFNWGGNGATLGRLRKKSMMVPITIDNEIDYEYMDSYMRRVEDRLLEEYISRKLKDDGQQ